MSDDTFSFPVNTERIDDEQLAQQADLSNSVVEQFRGLLQENRFSIVQQLIASETGALSVKELVFRSEKAETTIRRCLAELEDEGYVNRLTPDVDTVPRGFPRVFFTPSPKTLYLIDRIGLWETHGMLYELYDSLERTDEIVRIEQWDARPVPEWVENETVVGMEHVESWFDGGGDAGGDAGDEEQNE